MLTKFFAILCATAAIGCKTMRIFNEQESDLQGHYENSDASAMSNYKNKQTIPAEYSKTHGVILSESAFQKWRNGLFAEIFNSDVEKVYLIVRKGFPADYQQADFSQFKESLGESAKDLVLLKVDSEVNLWARDWAPIFALPKINSNRKWHTFDFNYNKFDWHPEDEIPFKLAKIRPEFSFRISMPLYLQGGNFMIDDTGHCVTSNRGLEENQTSEQTDDLVVKDAKDLQSRFFGPYLGCKKTTVVPFMPEEHTKHVDVWLKFAPNKKILIAEILPQTLAVYESQSEEFKKTLSIQKYLEKTAIQFQKLGYEVLRIPMPLPLFEYGNFRSYTNSLFVNQRVLIPKYQDLWINSNAPAEKSYPDKHLLSKYEELVKKAYEKAGFKDQAWIPADDIVNHKGSVHCITMQIPSAPSANP